MTRLGMPKPRGVAGFTLVQVAALVLPFWFVAMTEPGRYVVLLCVSLLIALGWEAIFAGLRKRAPSFHGATTALIVAIIVPPENSIWQLVVAMSLGVVFGELVFGGRGFGFLNPAAVVLALLVISSPNSPLSAPAPELALATLPGAMLLFALGLISARVVLAAVGAVVSVLELAGHVAGIVEIATGLSFGLIFLISDPTAAAATNAGRWIYGALAGGLVGLFSLTWTITSEAVVFAAVVAGVFAPLIDNLVVLAHAYRWRRRRHV